MNPNYSFITTFGDFNFPENIFNISNVLFAINYWQKYVRVTIIINLKYYYTTMAKNHELYSPVILEKNFKK